MLVELIAKKKKINQTQAAFSQRLNDFYLLLKVESELLKLLNFVENLWKNIISKWKE